MYVTIIRIRSAVLLSVGAGIPWSSQPCEALSNQLFPNRVPVGSGRGSVFVRLFATLGQTGPRKRMRVSGLRLLFRADSALQ